MNRIYVLSVVTVVAVAIAFVAGRNTDAQIRTQLEAASSSAVQYEYAQLEVRSEDEYLWLQGDLNLTPEPVTLETLAQRLRQRNGRKTFANLLNQIGSNGWELIAIDGSTRYTFMRRL